MCALIDVGGVVGRVRMLIAVVVMEGHGTTTAGGVVHSEIHWGTEPSSRLSGGIIAISKL
jgi:hypothetical protein